MNIQHILEVALGVVLGYLIIKDLQKNEKSIFSLLGKGLMFFVFASVLFVIGFGVLYFIAWMTDKSNPWQGFQTNVEIYLLICGLWLFDYLTVKILNKTSGGKLTAVNGFWNSGISSFFSMYIVMLPLMIIFLLISNAVPSLGEKEFESNFGINPFLIGLMLCLGWAVTRHFFVRFGIKSKVLLTKVFMPEGSFEKT